MSRAALEAVRAEGGQQWIDSPAQDLFCKEVPEDRTKGDATVGNGLEITVEFWNLADAWVAIGRDRTNADGSTRGGGCNECGEEPLCAFAEFAARWCVRREVELVTQRSVH